MGKGRFLILGLLLLTLSYQCGAQRFVVKSEVKLRWLEIILPYFPFNFVDRFHKGVAEQRILNEILNQSYDRTIRAFSNDTAGNLTHDI